MAGDSGGERVCNDNGNLTFDGTQVYTYDAWNRLVGVAHGYTDGSGDVQSGETFDTMSYDGLGRLITEAISGEGSGHDQTYQNYYDGDQLIEQKTGDDDGSGATIKQNVWGLQYVNDLVQTAVNSNPGTDNTCDTAYTALQDAGWNVKGIVDSSGNLVRALTEIKVRTSIRDMFYSGAIFEIRRVDI
ncbi:MAG TPA: hypothetical protein VHQ47_03250 [Phycisphaerae bacterium]|nr:hypothetical protein [Phycisphaerae bacterium]